MNKAVVNAMSNPLFQEILVKDLEQQEKYFGQEPPPVPTKWI